MRESTARRSKSPAVPGDTRLAAVHNSKLDGSTGGAPFVDTSRTYAQEARVEFLATNFTILLINAMAGRVVYHQTNSLTMEIDFVTFGIDLLALSINIAVEISKRKMEKSQNIFIVDLIGCFISLTFLIVVAVWGLIQSLKRERDAERGTTSEDQVDHVGTMFIYSLFSLALSAVTMSVFWLRKDVMYPDGFGEEDRLNTVSSMAHTIVDFCGTLAVFGTSTIMIHEESQGGARWRKFQDVVQADVYGSMLICLVTFVTCGVLLREAFSCTSKILCPLPDDNDPEDGEFRGDSTDYGATRPS